MGKLTLEGTELGSLLGGRLFELARLLLEQDDIGLFLRQQSAEAFVIDSERIKLDPKRRKRDLVWVLPVSLRLSVLLLRPL